MGTDIRDQIAQKAYEKYKQRGGMHGYDMQDWLAAEQELTEKPKSRAKRAPKTTRTTTTRSTTKRARTKT
ncbi:MAG: DUF2934 domain-containing protein [Chitinivibrionales bacterium]|nr:DUF2934 domain-containing protein [Chitinivibrionales bacterium]